MFNIVTKINDTRTVRPRERGNNLDPKAAREFIEKELIRDAQKYIQFTSDKLN